MTDQDPAGRPDHALERLIFFSDAVFAIAITLLVIEIHVPHLPYRATDGDYLHALLDLVPSLFGFFVSFAVIGAFWSVHHRAFSLAAHHSQPLVRANLALLCAVVFMPFSTAFLGANIGARVPGLVYDLTLMATGLLNWRLVRMATRPPVIAAQVPAETAALIRVRGLAVVAASACAFGLTFVDARFSQIGLLSIPLWRRLFQALVVRRRPAAG